MTARSGGRIFERDTFLEPPSAESGRNERFEQGSNEQVRGQARLSVRIGYEEQPVVTEVTDGEGSEDV
jgi:hypothetical protein